MGKSIITYLIDSDPQGARYVTIGNRPCQMFVVPKSVFSTINQRPELQQPAFYILLGEDESQMEKAYLGQTENFMNRVKDHNTKKLFWQKALIFIANNKSIDKGDVLYLEHLAVEQATIAKRCRFEENKQKPKAPTLTEYQTDIIRDFFEDVKLLTGFVGCNIFEVVKKSEKHIFTIKDRGSDASGFFDSDGFTVLQGSKLAKGSVPSFSGKENRLKQIKTLTKNVSGSIILNFDETFNSPSTAANFCIGSNVNGWIAWKDKTGKTLDEVYRKK
jgi:hypothetical protein